MDCNVHAHVMFTYNARFLQGTHESFDVVICSQSLLNLYSMFTYNANEFCMDYMDHSMLFFAHNLCLLNPLGLYVYSSCVFLLSSMTHDTDTKGS